MNGSAGNCCRSANAFRSVVAALLLGLLVGTAAAAEKLGPRIYVTEGRFDLGTVEQGMVPEHVFEIRNLGDEVLEIGQVQPT